MILLLLGRSQLSGSEIVKIIDVSYALVLTFVALVVGCSITAPCPVLA